MTAPVIYRNVEAVLNVLNNQKVDNRQAVTTLLQVYDKALKASKDVKDVPRHPMIILEGLDGCGKSTITRRLNRKLEAVRWCTPPDSIKHIRHLFDDNLQLRNAYYAIGNYIAALECAVVLRERPVIMDRYWHSTAAFGIAQAVHDFQGDMEMPPEGDSFYHWPEDLLKPDAVFFLDVREDVRLHRLSRRSKYTTQEKLLIDSKQFRDNVILAYRNMVDPEVIFVNANFYPNKLVPQIVDRVKHLLHPS